MGVSAVADSAAHGGYVISASFPSWGFGAGSPVPAPFVKGLQMRVKMTLLVLLAWAGGCVATINVGTMTATVRSIPEGMFAWDVTVPAFTSTASFDPAKVVEFGVQGITNIVGMLPTF
ncbi:hypothetical protein LCGC14_1098400 [marine sediment metagenome]|uniref:Uncharacterized protein n=1 Tax=marine sediment metagenome TaxID=412755 RepID=A0A0F9PTI3_9ZZZZ